jgi:hypothetical protein
MIAPNLIRARTVLCLAWWLALEVAARGWLFQDQLTVVDLAMTWSECDAPMGWS